MIDATARGGGYFDLFVNGVEVSRHTAEREAIERGSEYLAADPAAPVWYAHDYVVDLTVGGVTPRAIPDAPTGQPGGNVVELVDRALGEPTERVLVRTNSLQLGIDIARDRSRERWRVQRIHVVDRDAEKVVTIGYAWRGIVLIWKDTNVRVDVTEA